MGSNGQRGGGQGNGRIGTARAWGQLVGGAAAAVLGFALYRGMVDFPGVVAVELGGSEQRWPPAEDGLRAAVYWDFALVVGYTLAMVLLLDLGRRVFFSARSRRFATVALACAVLAAVADVVENVALLVALGTEERWLLTVAAAAAVVKFSVFAVAAPVALAAAGTTLWRLFADATRRRFASGATRSVQTWGVPGAAAPAGEQSSGSGRWAQGYVVPDIETELEERARTGKGAVGFCVSGGGIRSASVALGALQGLRSKLLGSRYLVSVSGGGYTAGAMQMALQPAPTGSNAATATDVFAAGSLEEDHLRRHSRYIADGAGQWLVALAVLARGLLFSLVMLTFAVMAAGLVVGLAYRAVPLVADAPLDPPGPAGTFFEDLRAALVAGGSVPAFPALAEGVATALIVVGLASLVLYVVSLWAFVESGEKSESMMAVTKAAVGLLVLIALLGMGLPALMWLSVRAFRLADGAAADSVAVGGAGTVVIAYVVTLVGMMWRQRTTLVAWFKSLVGKGTSIASKAGSRALVPRLLVSIGLALLAALFLLLFAAVAVVAAGLPAGGIDWSDRNLQLAAAGGLALAVAWALVDQSWVSLHPFYRRRLASAFAVRRVRRESGMLEAEGYEYAERTRLSEYGRRHASTDEHGNPRPDFPEVVFAAAANLSGQDRTPPGRRAASFTQTAEWVGGPDVGYARTRDLERATSPHVQRDLTVQAAVAVSGAAFASAMGRQARAFQTYFALTNARLGTWLPNPAFMRRWSAARSDESGDWRVPDAPRLRRLGYLVREVLGVFPCEDRFLFVTDGGHYEVLGLVELLRRRCTTIYCIDASGDTPPTAQALADAIDLAYEELGVRIELDDEWSLVPGGGTAIEPKDPLAALNGRLSRTAVVRGDVFYPPESGLPEGGIKGTLIVAKAVLTPDLPYPLLTHAVRAPSFPNDTTADQWFDHTQFTAYTALGRELARRVDAVESTAKAEDEAKAQPLQASVAPEPPDGVPLRLDVTDEIERILPEGWMHWVGAVGLHYLSHRAQATRSSRNGGSVVADGPPRT